MAAIINTNVASLNAQRNLSSSQSSMNTSLQRLSCHSSNCGGDACQIQIQGLGV